MIGKVAGFWIELPAALRKWSRLSSGPPPSYIIECSDGLYFCFWGQLLISKSFSSKRNGIATVLIEEHATFHSHRPIVLDKHKL